MVAGTAYEKALRQEGVSWELSPLHDRNRTGSQQGLGRAGPHGPCQGLMAHPSAAGAVGDLLAGLWCPQAGGFTVLSSAPWRVDSGRRDHTEGCSRKREQDSFQEQPGSGGAWRHGEVLEMREGICVVRALFLSAL